MLKYHIFTLFSGSILAVLNDPAFELRQPSWVRSSIRVKHLTPPTATSTREREEVDWGKFEVEMEFISQEEEGTQARVRLETVFSFSDTSSCSPGSMSDVRKKDSCVLVLHNHETLEVHTD